MNAKIKAKFVEVAKDVAKFALGALLGAFGFSLTGCTCLPVFNF